MQERKSPTDCAEVIRTEALTKTYAGGVTAVQHLDLSVRQGEVFGLLGPNGAGKTTTISMLTTRLVPSGGRAMINGADVVANPVRVKQSIGVVQDINTLDRSLTAWENLYFHGRYFGMGARRSRAAADEMLERFRLSERARAPITTLSRGMAQRLMLARAVLHRPEVVFLDEPTAGLDPQSRLALWELMSELHAGGETILLTTHYLEEADRLCDRVAIMDHGRVLALDTPSHLKRSMGSGAHVLVRAAGDLDRLATELARVPGATDATPDDGAVRLHLFEAEGAVLKLVAAATRAGFEVTELSVSEPTLESVFIDLTGRELRE